MVVSEVMHVVACGITFSAKVANARSGNNEAFQGWVRRHVYRRDTAI